LIQLGYKNQLTNQHRKPETLFISNHFPAPDAKNSIFNELVYMFPEIAAATIREGLVLGETMEIAGSQRGCWPN
jgi:hypothetical protein